jgi:hypothetical protein
VLAFSEQAAPPRSRATLLVPMLPEAPFGIPDERRHVQLQEQPRRIERRFGAGTPLGN